MVVFAGSQGWKNLGIVDTINRDIRVSQRIKFVSPTDEQLDVLYRHCTFILLPSIYEGWCVALAEGLAYGKFALVSDVPPLRETGEDYVDYIHPYDTAAWADKIYHYSTCLKAIKEKEEKISRGWKTVTWEDCARDIIKQIDTLGD
jgi:glycosyltransferase involved in cell wall biosynthesis